MVVTTAQLTGFVGEMNRAPVLAHVERLMNMGIEKDEAITQTIEAIIHEGKAPDFVRQFGMQIIKSIMSNAESLKRPANAPAPTDRDDRNGQRNSDTHISTAALSSPEPIPQKFHEPDGGRRIDIGRLRDPNLLKGVLSGKWDINGVSVAMGLMTGEQCFKVSASEGRMGRTKTQNSIMFRRLGESLSPGEVVVDRWDEAGIMMQFELAEPPL